MIIPNSDIETQIIEQSCDAYSKSKKYVTTKSEYFIQERFYKNK